MRGAIINLAEGMLPFFSTIGTPQPQMGLQEAVYWLWRVRTVFVTVDIVVTGEDEDGDPVNVVDLHFSAVVTVPLGVGNTGSRTEADQLVSRRAFAIDQTTDDGIQVILIFAGGITPQAFDNWYIGMSFEVRQSGVTIIKLGDPTLPAAPIALELSGEDLVLGEFYEHIIPINGIEGSSGAITISPLFFQTWSLNGVPLYDSTSGAILP